MSLSERTVVLINVIADEGNFWGNTSIDCPDEADELVEELCRLSDHLPSCAAAHMYDYEDMASFVFTTKEDAATAIQLMRADGTNWDGRTNYVSDVFLLSDLEKAQEKIRYCLNNEMTYADYNRVQI